MVRVQREILPNSYLLILEDGPTGPELPLERGLFRAARSNKQAIWIDCSMVSELPKAAAELLLAYQHHFPQVGKELVLSHVTEAVAQQLLELRLRETPPRIVPSLLDADDPSVL